MFYICNTYFIRIYIYIRNFLETKLSIMNTWTIISHVYMTYI